MENGVSGLSGVHVLIAIRVSYRWLCPGFPASALGSIKITRIWIVCALPDSTHRLRVDLTSAQYSPALVSNSNVIAYVLGTFIFNSKFEVDCELSPWTKWSSCSASCDGGQQRRTRDIVSAGRDGGKSCQPPFEQQRLCNSHICNGW